MANKPELRLTDQQRFDWLRLVRSENVGPRTFRALVTNCGSVASALKALPDLARRGGAKRPIRIASVEEVEKELIAARKLGVRFVALGEADYPPALQEIDSAPPILALRGQAAALRKAAVAIVGSRNASAAGLTFAERLARGLGQGGYVVVSGLARGIDQRAHVASLETGAVGVLAGGHGKPYPGEAVPLMERMIELGAVVSEMPIEWEPRGRDFPRRNRIVSGLALGVVVVEAARGSGSLITARFALEQNRQVFAVPGSPLDPRAEGTNDLLKQGASICTGADDVLTALEPVRPNDLAAMRETSGEPGEPLWGEQALYGVDPQSTPRTRPGEEFDDASGAPYSAGDDAEAARERIVALLGPSPITLDELARAAEASARAVRVALLELEVAGRVEYSGDRVALRAKRQRKLRSSGASVERIVPARESNRNVEGLLFVGVIVCALGFGDGVGANVNFAFRFGHPKEISEQVEAGRDRHGFELGSHVRDVTSDIERFVRDSPLRRIVSPSGQSPRPVSSGSPLFSTYASRETHFLNHTTTLSRSAEGGGPFQALYSGVIAILNARLALIRAQPQSTR